MKIPDVKESQSPYSKLAMFHFLLSSLHVKMHGIICELHAVERIRKTKLNENDSSNSPDKLASLSEVIAQEAGGTSRAEWETFLVTKKQQMHRPHGGEIKPTIHMSM